MNVADIEIVFDSMRVIKMKRVLKMIGISIKNKKEDQRQEEALFEFACMDV